MASAIIENSYIRLFYRRAGRSPRTGGRISIQTCCRSHCLILHFFYLGVRCWLQTIEFCHVSTRNKNGWLSSSRPGAELKANCRLCAGRSCQIKVFAVELNNIVGCRAQGLRPSQKSAVELRSDHTRADEGCLSSRRLVWYSAGGFLA